VSNCTFFSSLRIQWESNAAPNGNVEMWICAHSLLGILLWIVELIATSWFESVSLRLLSLCRAWIICTVNSRLWNYLYMLHNNSYSFTYTLDLLRTLARRVAFWDLESTLWIEDSLEIGIVRVEERNELCCRVRNAVIRSCWFFSSGTSLESCVNCSSV
jgi:hypothetical protein